MSNSTATHKRNVTCDFPDYVSTDIVFQLTTLPALSTANEIFMADDTFYTLALNASGAGNIDLPTPDGVGTAAWSWRIELPDTKAAYFDLTWNASAISLATLLS